MWRAHQVVLVPESQETIAVAESLRPSSRGDHLRLHGHVHPFLLLAQFGLPFGHSLLRFFQEFAIVLALEQRQQLVQHAPAIAHQADLHGITQADTARVEIDLYAARFARLRHELDIGERTAGDEHGVALFQRGLRGFRAEQADTAGGIGAVIGDRGLAEQRLDDGGAQFFRDRFQLLAGA